MKGERPWGIDAKYDIALPCATQNEVGCVAASPPLGFSLLHPHGPFLSRNIKKRRPPVNF